MITPWFERFSKKNNVSVIVTKEALGVIVQDHQQQQLVILPTDLSHQQEP